MLDQRDGYNTNRYEQNPTKCHFNEVWSNASSVRTNFNNYWYRPPMVRQNTVTVKGIYKTTTMGIEIECAFYCDLVINSTFPNLYTSTLIHRGLEGEAEGRWFNLTTLT
jgi:hypothetical protein